MIRLLRKGPHLNDFPLEIAVRPVVCFDSELRRFAEYDPARSPYTVIVSAIQWGKTRMDLTHSFLHRQGLAGAAFGDRH